MKVLAVANGFGFGPIAILNSILSSIPDRFDVDVYVPYCLTSVASQVTGLYASNSVTLISIDDFDSIECTKYDAAIISSDYVFAQKVEKVLDRIVIIDALFWFWEEPWEVDKTKTLIIAQNFYGVDERAKSREEVKVVQPILPPYVTQKTEANQKDSILVNLGGFSSPLHKREYAIIYAKMLKPMLETLSKNAKQLIVAGGECIIQAIQKFCTFENMTATTFSHESMIREIKMCKYYFTIPGLGSIYESLSLGLVPSFLPATNLTQFLQARELEEKLNYRWVSNWCGLNDQSALSSNNEEYFIDDLFLFYTNNIDANKKRLHKHSTEFIAAEGYLSPTDAENIIRFLDFSHEPNDSVIDEIIKHLGV